MRNVCSLSGGWCSKALTWGEYINRSLDRQSLAFGVVFERNLPWKNRERSDDRPRYYACSCLRMLMVTLSVRRKFRYGSFEEKVGRR
jgi:hypothetical protein